MVGGLRRGRPHIPRQEPMIPVHSCDHSEGFRVFPSSRAWRRVTSCSKAGPARGTLGKAWLLAPWRGNHESLDALKLLERFEKQELAAPLMQTTELPLSLTPVSVRSVFFVLHINRLRVTPITRHCQCLPAQMWVRSVTRSGGSASQTSPLMFHCRLSQNNLICSSPGASSMSRSQLEPWPLWCRPRA